MRRFGLIMSVVGVVLVGVFTTMERKATAQEATPDTTAMMAMATHPIVGTWRWDNDPANPADDSYGIFHADGTYLEVTTPTNVGVGVGAWTPTGPRTADLLTIFIDTDPGEGFAPGTGTFLTAMTVDETGNAFTGIGDLQARDPDGTVTFEASGWTFTGTKVTVAPLPDFGAWQESTPMAGTPAP